MLLKKIYTLVLIIFVILTIYTIPIVSLKNKNAIKTNLEIQEISSPTTKIYLLNKDNYLVQVEVILENTTKEEKIKSIIDYLIVEENNNSNLQGIIPKNTKLLEIKIDSNRVILNFSKEFLSQKEKEKQMITGIVYSLLELDNIEKVSFQVEGKEIEGWMTEYDKKIGMNLNYRYHTRENLSKIVIYYLDDTKNHFIPVTNYLNNEKEKIEIIIEELKNHPNNLISLIPYNLELIDYREEENVLFLNFNSYLVDANDEITNKVLKEIAYSVFDNYDVNMIFFETNHNRLKYIMREKS